MKWFLSGTKQETETRHAAQRLRLGLAAAAVVFGGLVARAELAEWVRFVESGSALREVFFRPVALPAGPVMVRRPPSETRPALGRLIQTRTSEADLYALRAHEAERDLDFEAAEADWKQYASSAADTIEGSLALADFYQRRLRPDEEAAALLAAGRLPAVAAESLTPAAEQRSWQAFERSLTVIEAHALTASLALTHYRAWLERYPQQGSIYQRFFEFLTSKNLLSEAEALIADYQKAFPQERVFPVRARANLARLRGSDDQALAFYDQAFEPLWPQALIHEYFSLLDQTHQLRSSLDRAKATLAERPEDLRATVWLFYYYQRQGNWAAAQSALSDLRQHREGGGSSWTPEDLFTLARLYESANNHNEAARYYYALYSLPQASDGEAEDALTGLVNLLLTAPERPIQFGAENLSFYRDIATIDDHPGFLNGILSLLLNSQNTRHQYSSQERTAVAYFHRARAAQLVQLVDSRFPQSSQRQALHARLIDAYATYGDSEGVIEAAKTYLADFPEAPWRTQVALRMAEAYARLERESEEFATYDSLLEELARRADGVPVGKVPSPPGRAAQYNRRTFTPGRSPEYVQVLDRYLARLTALQRERDALSLYAREVARNPDDPGLYERLAALLEQNGLGVQIEQVYRRAIAKFQDRSWYHKLARWYLRQRQASEFGQLTREVVELFSGTDLDDYFREIVRAASARPQLYLQLNLYAHQRFPHNLTFVRNLLSAYQTRQTRDQAAWEKLLHEYWFYDDDLRSRFFAFLTGQGRLETERAALEASLAPASGGQWDRLTAQNPAAARLLAEAQLWRCHFEAAVPALRALADEFATDESLAHRAAAVHRSLSYAAPDLTEAAVGIERNIAAYKPADRAQRALLGDIWADRERYDLAQPYWDAMAEIEPGKPEGYLDAATVFWDYYLFDDALRLLSEGRRRLNQSSLYAFEAGAVYENKREYERAIEEYLRGVLSAQTDARARARLLRLSRRPAHRALIDQATERLVGGQNPDLAAVSLRVAVLEAQQRPKDLEQFLLRLADAGTSLELLERLHEIARRQHLNAVEVRVLERQIAILTDPVERMRLTLALMHLHEGRADFRTAEQLVENLYRENSEVLGVVRAAADYHWRRKDYDRSLQVLQAAARASHSELGHQFTFEVARKATEAGRYELARASLRTLLETDPFRPDYLAAMAETFGREQRYDALRVFYEEKLAAIGDAALSASLKKERTATLRRGLIPALDQLGETAAALDQYIEIVNRFPEDQELVLETSRYADRHGLRERLLDFYKKTTAESPKDYRYHRVLAWVETEFENYPAAIEAYRRAAEVRPDRTDLFETRADLEQRLMRFDDALGTYEQLYKLTYEDPRWMEKIAEVKLRQGKRQEAVDAIEKAFIRGRPERPEHYFAAAERLEGWNLLAEARPFAEKGVELAGAYLFRDADYTSGARLYARLMTRLREYEPAYSRLRDSWQALGREAWAHEFQRALVEIGATVDRFFTPEEKGRFITFLEGEKLARTPRDVDELLLPVVVSAGLTELEAAWRYERMMAEPGFDSSQAQRQRLIELQGQRLRHAELGRQLETYWQVHPRRSDRDGILREAAEAYRTAGDEEAELRALERADLEGERFFALLLKRNPQRLVALSQPTGPRDTPDRPVNFAVAAGDFELALEAVQARGVNLPSVWTDAYTGLAGLYHGRQTPRIDGAFERMLGTATIGERIGKTVDRDLQLAGDLWFYYGARYGDYLAAFERSGAADYLPAEVENAPGRASAYLALGDSYRERGDHDDALAEFERVLQLQPANASVYDRMALILWEQGKRDQAVGHWKTALELLAKQADIRAMPGTFWDEVPRLLDGFRARGLMAALQTETRDLLEKYVRRNGAYRSESLLRAFVEASPDKQAATAFALELSAHAPNAAEYLSSLVEAPWVPSGSRESVFIRLLDAARGQVEQSQARAEYYAQQRLDSWRIRWIEFLLDTKQGQRAAEEINDLPAGLMETLRRQHPALLLRSAAQTGRLADLLADYRADREPVSDLRHFRDAAEALRKAGDSDSADRILEFFYTFQIERRDLSPSNFLGLAELRFEAGQPEQALGLLRRMALMAPEPFSAHVPAADLLAEVRRHAEAAEFLAERTRAVPWDVEAKWKLAREEQAANAGSSAAKQRLASVASAHEAPYETRVEAAKLLRPVGGSSADPGSGELTALASPRGLTPQQAPQPLFFHARLAAAEAVVSVSEKHRLLREALEIAPESLDARLAVFKTARAQRDHHLAAAAVIPLLEPTGFGYELRQPDSILGENTRANASQSWSTDMFLGAEGLAAGERARLAGQAADSHAKVGRLQAAELLYEFALQLEPAPADRTVFESALENIRKELQVRAENARRRPVITKNLEQDRRVAPRLGAVAQGGVQ